MSEDLLSLIKSGKLKVGTTLYFKGRRHRERNTIARVVDEGLIVGGQAYSTPSAAAMSITGHAINGWKFWRLPTGELIDTLRSEHRQRKSP